MRNHYLLILFFLASCSLHKSTSKVDDVVLTTFETEDAKKYAESIIEDDLNKHLSILACDEFEGRETARPGQKKAAKYISEQFKSFGLTPGNKGSYLQSFPVHAKNSSNVYLTINGVEYKLLDDFYYLGNLMDTVLTDIELIYAGYGIEDENYSDYDRIDVKGKVVLIKEGNPSNSEESNDSWRNKYNAAITNGAVGVITIKDDFEQGIERVKVYLENPNLEMHNKGQRKGSLWPNLFISEELKNKLFEDEKLIASKVSIRVDIQELLSSENVLGYIEGSDLKDELVVVTSHYDHLGYDNGEVCNGADDDGSGTVSVIELAQAFQDAKDDGKGPRRSILFMTFSGEEKGLWGSKYYTDNPVYSLKNTVVDLNIDMVGRRDDEHDNDNYIYLIGADRISKDLHDISELVNKKFINFDFDYTYNKDDDPNQFYYRSDHYNFAKNEIPVIFYFSGVHEDYHKPTDDVEKINFTKLERTARLVFYTAWEIANRDQKLRK